MSVIVTIWVTADTEKFREYALSHEDVLRGISAKARAQGCLSHRFALGDGNLLVIDEWESGEQFQKFFADPQIAAVMQESGIQGQPNIAVLEPLDTADRF
jgi:quinol monooxygenase YgiN